MGKAVLPSFVANSIWEAIARVPQGRRHAFLESIVEYIYTYHLHEGDIAIDVGAHRARHTIPMASKVGRSGKVYAVEAAPEMRDKLRAAINHSGVDKIRNIVTYLDCAVSDRTGTMDFYYVPQAAGMSGLAPQQYPEGANVIVEQVEVCRLDDIIPVDTPVRFIKMDIEGAEFHALKGAQQLLEASRPLIVFEYTGQSAARRYNYTSDQFFKFWSDLGYCLFTAAGDAHGPENWGQRGPHDLLAAPVEQASWAQRVAHAAVLRAAAEHLARIDG
nr:FkbM family methyltransferase [Xanthobacter agilis]